MASVSGSADCGDVDAYIVCLIRVLNVTEAGVMQQSINEQLAKYGNPSNCSLNVSRLVQSVKDGTAPPPPTGNPATREKEKAYNFCMNTYMAALQGANLAEDPSRICGPLKMFMKCVWRAFGVDTSAMNRQQTAHAQLMMTDQLSQLKVTCDFSLETLISEMKSEKGGGSDGGSGGVDNV